MLKPTLIGGTVAGIVGGLPLIGGLNCACCALVVGGGFLAAFLYSKQCQKTGTPFRPASGATVGLIAGLFYAIAHSVVGFLVQLAMPFDVDEVMGQMEQANLPPETAETIRGFLEMLTKPIGILIGFFMLLLLGAIFSTLGGLIGGAVFKVEPPPPPPPRASDIPSAPAI